MVPRDLAVVLGIEDRLAPKTHVPQKAVKVLAIPNVPVKNHDLSHLHFDIYSQNIYLKFSNFHLLVILVSQPFDIKIARVQS